MIGELGIEKSQKLFGKSILTGENEKDLLDAIIPAGKIDISAALQVYRDDYVARLTSVLGENYEGTWSLLGDKLFFSLCEEYLIDHRSKSFDIGDFGEDLDQFVKDHPLGEEFPFLFELCHLDKQFMRIFHLPIQKALGEEQLKSCSDLSKIKFKFAESFYLQKSNFPIYKIWDLKNIPLEERNAIDLDWNAPESICLYKSSQGIHTKFLKPEQVDILDKLNQGLNLETALENSSLEPQEVQSLFNFIATSGIIVELV
ncbi:MAG: hypothetical protein DRQ88_02295 [Epsilonproteobacteria bacterium]|nr:MAG: hypothetical protein DRQ89_01040 [Campylobacterota bacterium]RLA67691.1 MAG: hypothetical protein DRQ88_02295 [Campylobacterota bacterium]